MIIIIKYRICIALISINCSEALKTQEVGDYIYDSLDNIQGCDCLQTQNNPISDKVAKAMNLLQPLKIMTIKYSLIIQEFSIENRSSMFHNIS